MTKNRDHHRGSTFDRVLGVAQLALAIAILVGCFRLEAIVEDRTADHAQLRRAVELFLLILEAEYPDDDRGTISGDDRTGGEPASPLRDPMSDS